MVYSVGLEPTTFWAETRYSNPTELRILANELSLINRKIICEINILVSVFLSADNSILDSSSMPSHLNRDQNCECDQS